MRKCVFYILPSVILLGVATLASGWWVKGHESITEAAATRLPDEVPAFFREGGKHLAHYAGDPDRWKNKDCKVLRASIQADHYLDLEDLDGKPLPPESRFKGITFMKEMKKDPERVGLLPYAIVEGWEKLACAFADHRKDPTNEAIRWKCLVYAGNLAHFTTDASMPLHTTVHYDGRVKAGEATIQKGIHAKLDAFPEKFGLKPEEMARDLAPAVVVDVWGHTQKFLAESHTHIDKCYEFDTAKAFENPTDASREFVMSRCRAGAQFTMDVWYSAWIRSAKLPAHY